MHIKITRSKNSTIFYIIESYRHNGKSTSRIVEKLGSLEEVILKAQGQDPYVWANQQAVLRTQQEHQAKRRSKSISPITA